MFMRIVYRIGILLLVHVGLLVQAASGAGEGTTAVSTAPIKSITITAKVMKSEPGGNRAVFEGSVVARSEDLTLEAERMVVEYAEGAGTISTIECEGSVKVVQGDKVIMSQRARYEETEKLIVFTGEPRILQDRTMVTGREIRYYPETDEIQVSDGTVIINR